MKSRNRNQIRALTIVAFEILDHALVQWLQFRCCIRWKELEREILEYSVSELWQGAWSINSRILRFCFNIFLFTPASHSSNRLAVIQLVRLDRQVTGSSLIFTFLKQRGLADFPKFPFLKERVLQTKNVCLSVCPTNHRAAFPTWLNQSMIMLKRTEPMYSSLANSNLSSVCLQTNRSASNQQKTSFWKNRLPGSS